MKLPAILGALLLMLPACVAPPRPREQSAAQARPGDKPAWKRSCREYAGAPVKLTYQDAPGGSAVLYRTKGDVRRLRGRTAEVARFHNAGTKAPAMHDLYHIPHRAYVEDIKGGAKLVLVPKNASLQVLDELRRNVQQEVTIMQKQGCGHGQEAL